jgi:hypothetical protein
MPPRIWAISNVKRKSDFIQLNLKKPEESMLLVWNFIHVFTCVPAVSVTAKEQINIYVILKNKIFALTGIV